MNRKQAGIGLGVGVAAFVGLIALSGQYVPPTGAPARVASLTTAGAISSTYSGSPDGVVTASRGSVIVDSATGITWKNRSGSTRWDPTAIPMAWGFLVQDDFTGVLPTTANIGGGTVGMSAAGATPGIFNFTVAAAGVDGGVIRQNVGAWVAGGGVFTFRARLKIDTLSDGTNNAIVRVGSGDATTFADVTDGIWFENDYALNGDNVWRICTASGGTRTRTTTGIAAVANTWTTLEIRVNAAGTSVTGEIDGVAIPTPVTDNIPVTDGGTLTSPGWMQVLKQTGATSRVVRIDWWNYWQVLTVARGL